MERHAPFLVVVGEHARIAAGPVATNDFLSRHGGWPTIISRGRGESQRRPRDERWCTPAGRPAPRSTRLVRHRQRRQNGRVIPWLRAGAQFPPIDSALDEPNGLLVAGGDLSPQRLLDAYRHGIFPWYSEGQPILWWSPDPRTVLYTGEFKVPRSLRKVANQRRFAINRRHGFRRRHSRLRGASRGRERHVDYSGGCCGRTASFTDWATRTRSRHGADDGLVGGLYGVAIGRMFFGESMFAPRGRRVPRWR